MAATAGKELVQKGNGLSVEQEMIQLAKVTHLTTQEMHLKALQSTQSNEKNKYIKYFYQLCLLCCVKHGGKICIQYPSLILPSQLSQFRMVRLQICCRSLETAQLFVACSIVINVYLIEKHLASY